MKKTIISSEFCILVKQDHANEEIFFTLHALTINNIRNAASWSRDITAATIFPEENVNRMRAEININPHRHELFFETRSDKGLPEAAAIFQQNLIDELKKL